MISDRIADKIDVADCWQWTGVTTRLGYGSVSVDGITKSAHRVVYEALVGPVPPECGLDHLCRNRSCVNPDHLEPTTHRENVLRGEGIAAKNARKTHCIVGHPFTGDNLIIRGNGRQCRECGRKRSREYMRALRKNKTKKRK